LILCFLSVSECSELHPCEGLSKHAHFQNFGMAFLTLFRVATGDNWNGIMKVFVTFLLKSIFIDPVCGLDIVTASTRRSCNALHLSVRP